MVDNNPISTQHGGRGLPIKWHLHIQIVIDFHSPCNIWTVVNHLNCIKQPIFCSSYMPKYVSLAFSKHGLGEPEV